MGSYQGKDNGYKWQHRFIAADGDFVFQRGKVQDRSLLFQGEVLSCGVGPASVLLR